MRIDWSSRFRSLRLAKLRKAWRAFRADLRPARRLMVGALACGLGATLMQVLRPWPIKIVFDAVLPAQGSLPADPRLERLSASLGDHLVLAVCLSLLAISLAWGALNYGQTFLTARAGQSLVYSLRYKVFAHLQRLSLRFHQGQQRGDLLMRMTGDINLMRDMLVNALLTAVSATLLLAAMLGVLLFMDWKLALVVVGLLPLLALTTFRFSFRIREAARRQRKSEGKIAAAIGEMLAGVRTIQAHGREQLQERRFRRSNRRNLKAGLKATRLEASMARAVELLLATATAAVFWFGVRRVVSGHLTPGDLLVFVSYVHASFRPLRRLSRMCARVAKAQASSERLLSVLRSTPEVVEVRRARKAKRIAGAIDVSKLGLTFASGQKALNRLSFAIEPKSFVGIVGPSGAGKSTFLMTLVRLYEPDRGRIRLDGRDLREYRLESLRGQFAILMQSPFLFGSTIGENIAFGRPRASEIEIVRAAKLAGALDFIRELPQGFDTPVAETGDSLSAGQRQRIAIARAFLREAPILLLDEPTTGLDAATEHQLMMVLRRLMEGRTTLMVAHSLACVREADRILVLKKGRLIESGTHDELLDLGGWYAHTWRTQSRKMKQRRELLPVPTRTMK